MLQMAYQLKDLNFSALMEVYLEGNLEKVEDGLTLLQAEQDFYQYLKESFFSVPGAVYCVWTEEGKYVSALRLEPYRDGLLLEALETAPEYRRKGYALRLMRAVLDTLGQTRVYSHVGKWNEASLKTHEKCGFRRILEHALYIDGSLNDRCCTMCYERENG